MEVQGSSVKFSQKKKKNNKKKKNLSDNQIRFNLFTVPARKVAGSGSDWCIQFLVKVLLEFRCLFGGTHYSG
jgi:hypothetical protein